LQGVGNPYIIARRFISDRRIAAMTLTRAGTGDLAVSIVKFVVIGCFSY
jgi:hypothetical protein